MNITDAQRALLKEYDIPFCEDIHELLLKLDDKIIAIGFEPDYNRLNPVGEKLQKLYDDLYYQN